MTTQASGTGSSGRVATRGGSLAARLRRWWPRRSHGQGNSPPGGRRRKWAIAAVALGSLAAGYALTHLLVPADGPPPQVNNDVSAVLTRTGDAIQAMRGGRPTDPSPSGLSAPLSSQSPDSSQAAPRGRPTAAEREERIPPPDLPAIPAIPTAPPATVPPVAPASAPAGPSALPAAAIPPPAAVPPPDTANPPPPAGLVPPVIPAGGVEPVVAPPAAATAPSPPLTPPVTPPTVPPPVTPPGAGEAAAPVVPPPATANAPSSPLTPPVTPPTVPPPVIPPPAASVADNSAVPPTLPSRSPAPPARGDNPATDPSRPPSVPAVDVVPPPAAPLTPSAGPAAPSAPSAPSAPTAASAPMPATPALSPPRRDNPPATTPPAHAERPPTTSYDVDIYEPKPGDTWEGISKEFYGDTRFAPALRAYNRNKPLHGAGPVDVPPLYILRRLMPGGSSGVVPASQTVPAGDPWNAPPTYSNRPLTSAGTSGTKIFRVPVDGMSLPTIARQLLGSEQRWVELYDLNPQVNAARVPAGTELRLPPDARLP